MRTADPENAPPKMRPGPPPGAHRQRCEACGEVLVRSCLSCENLLVPATYGSENIPPSVRGTLNVGDLEFVRRRIEWTSRKLAAELETTEEKVIAAITLLAARKLQPTGALGASGYRR